MPRDPATGRFVSVTDDGMVGFQIKWTTLVSVILCLACILCCLLPWIFLFYKMSLISKVLEFFDYATACATKRNEPFK